MPTANLLVNATVQPPQVQEHEIESIAKEMQVDVDQVRSLYQAERARLESQATVKTFVGVIATRLVRNALTRDA